MPFLQLDAILTKIYDLLRQDVRTIGIAWYNGRRSPAQMQPFPAGNVYLGAGSIVAFTMPAGETASARIIIEIVFADHAGATKAEQLMREGLDAAAQVLVDTWDWGLSYAYPEGLTWEAVIEPEASPAFAMARLFLDARVIPGG